MDYALKRCTFWWSDGLGTVTDSRTLAGTPNRACQSAALTGYTCAQHALAEFGRRLSPVLSEMRATIWLDPKGHHNNFKARPFNTITRNWRGLTTYLGHTPCTAHLVCTGTALLVRNPVCSAGVASCILPGAPRLRRRRTSHPSAVLEYPLHCDTLCTKTRAISQLPSRYESASHAPGNTDGAL